MNTKAYNFVTGVTRMHSGVSSALFFLFDSNQIRNF